MKVLLLSLIFGLLAIGTPVAADRTADEMVADTNSELLIETERQRDLRREKTTFNELDTAVNEELEANYGEKAAGIKEEPSQKGAAGLYEGEVKLCESYSKYAYPRWYRNINFKKYGYSYFNAEDKSNLRSTIKVKSV